MDKINSRQAGIIVFLSVIGLKAVLLPAIIYYFAGSGGYVSVFLCLITDFALLFAYLWIMKQNPSTKFFDIISSVIGKTAARIVMVIIFAYFMAKTFLLLVSTFNFFVQVLYDDMNWLFYVVSTLFLLFFALRKNIRTFGRCGEVIFWVVFVSINLVLTISSIGMDVTNALPFLQNGPEPILKTSFRCAYAFGDYTILIFIIGNIKHTPKTNTTIVSYAFMAIGTILNFFMVFLGIFGQTVVNQNLAIADLSLYIDLAVAVSRLEWIAVFAWTTTLVMQLTLYAYCTKEALGTFIPSGIKKHTPLIIVVALFLLYSIKDVTIQLLMNIFLSFPFAIFAISVQAGIPLLLVICNLINHRRKSNYVQLTSQAS